MKYDAQNVKIKDGELIMKQNGFSSLDHEHFDPVHVAGMQSRATDILHGSFSAELKLDGYDGGSCASFFWYHDNNQELDIEVVTPGTSIVNNTINYTTQPSTKSDWTPIPGATLSLPLKDNLNTFKNHRFECDAEKGVKYYLNDKLMHHDDHNIPRNGGSLQLKLWADGNKYWSGLPSSTDTFLRVKKIVAYYNTTDSLTDRKWQERCHKGKKQCKATMKSDAVYKGSKEVAGLPFDIAVPLPGPTEAADEAYPGGSILTKTLSVTLDRPWYRPTVCVGALSCPADLEARPTADCAAIAGITALNGTSDLQPGLAALRVLSLLLAFLIWMLTW